MTQPPSTSPQTETEAIEILRAKHTSDLFVAHCKTGPSTMAYGEGNGPLTLDAWVMPYSWVKPIIGYEVKVSRADFKRDKKWYGYLQYCNLFFFVVPHGLIEPAEIPAEAGLIWLTKTGRGVRIKKPAPLRCWHQIPQSVFQYVLMWRQEAPACALLPSLEPEGARQGELLPREDICPTA